MLLNAIECYWLLLNTIEYWYISMMIHAYINYYWVCKRIHTVKLTAQQGVWFLGGILDHDRVGLRRLHRWHSWRQSRDQGRQRSGGSLRPAGMYRRLPLLLLLHLHLLVWGAPLGDGNPVVRAFAVRRTEDAHDLFFSIHPPYRGSGQQLAEERWRLNTIAFEIVLELEIKCITTGLNIFKNLLNAIVLK